MIQSHTFVQSTLCGFADPAKLAQALESGAPVMYTPTVDDPMWNGFSRIRISGARCYLKGIRGLVSSNAPAEPRLDPLSIRIQLDTSGSFIDIQDKGRVTQALIPNDTTAPREALQNQSYIGAPRRLLFQYQPKDNKIVCDGLYGQAKDYTKHSPITTWNIKLLNAKGAVDFEGFTGLQLEFMCDVIWSGYAQGNMLPS